MSLTVGEGTSFWWLHRRQVVMVFCGSGLLFLLNYFRFETVHSYIFPVLRRVEPDRKFVLLFLSFLKKKKKNHFQKVLPCVQVLTEFFVIAEKFNQGSTNMLD